MMILGMAQHAARVKSKAREARRKKARQSGYRQVHYQRFQGRRDDAMEEETREANRARVRRSLAFMTTRLEAQERTNAQEGKPWCVVVQEEDGSGNASPNLLVVQPQVVPSFARGVLVEGPISPWEPLMEATVVSEGGPIGEQLLITFFFARP